MNVGLNMREARERAGLSQEAAAEKSGLCRTTIANYENGRRSPRMVELQKIAEAYGIEPMCFFKPYSSPGNGKCNSANCDIRIIFIKNVRRKKRHRLH